MKKERNYTITYINGGVIHYLKREQGCIIFTTNIKEAIKFIDREGAKTFIHKCLYGFRNHGFNIIPVGFFQEKTNLNPTSNRQKYVLLHKSGKSYYKTRHETTFSVTTAKIFDSIEEARKVKDRLIYPKGLFHIVPYNDLLKFEGNESDEYVLYNTDEKRYYKGVINNKTIYVNFEDGDWVFKGISEVRKHLASHWKSAHSWKILKYVSDSPMESKSQTLDEKINGLKEWVTHIAKTHNNAVDSSEKEIKNIKIRLDNIEHKVDAFLKDLKTSLERGL